MAKFVMMIITGQLLSIILIQTTLFIVPINSAPIIFVTLPIYHEIPLSLLRSLSNTIDDNNNNLKRVHRRELERQSSESIAIKKHLIMEQLKSNSDNDLETAAGTNVMRPLFVYRQQMAYRDRNSKRLADKRRAISDLLY